MGLQTWIASIAINKGIKKAVQTVVAFTIATLAKPGIASILSSVGIDIAIDPVQAQAGLTVIAMAGLEVIRNWFKTKLGIKWL